MAPQSWSLQLKLLIFQKMTYFLIATAKKVPGTLIKYKAENGYEGTMKVTPLTAAAARLRSADTLFGAVATVFGLPSLAYPFGRDQGLFFYAAREWRRWSMNPLTGSTASLSARLWPAKPRQPQPETSAWCAAIPWPCFPSAVTTWATTSAIGSRCSGHSA